MVDNVGLPPVANASAGLGPIPDQTEMNMPETKEEQKVVVVGTSGEPVAAKKKRGRPATGNGKKAQPTAAKAETRCQISVRYRLRAGEKIHEVRVTGRAKSPQAVQAMLLRWSREIETRWFKLG